MATPMLAWTRNLPESGTSREIATEAELLAKIAEAEETLRMLRASLRKHRKTTMAFVSANWTEAEIAAAQEGR